MNNPSDLQQIPSEVYEVAISGLLHAEAEDGCQMNGVLLTVRGIMQLCLWERRSNYRGLSCRYEYPR